MTWTDKINTVWQGDCLELMKEMPDKCVDLVVTDPPYNIGKAEWDKIENYIEWLGKIFKECERVLKWNGSFYFWHSEFDLITQINEWLRKNTDLKLNSFIIWDKGNFRSLAWKNPKEGNNLRSWFNTAEYCLFYTFQDETGLKKINNNLMLYKPIRDYFEQERKKTTLSYKEINEKCFGTASNGGGMASNILTPYKEGWTFPTKEKYKALQKIGICKREYDDLRREYDDLRFKHNLYSEHKNIWISNFRGEKNDHPTQKPLDLISRIIKTSSNKTDLIFDPFMGSWTTAVACQQLKRNFIGAELSAEYCAIGRERLRQQVLL